MPLITKKFVFVHVPKTGGRFFRRLMGTYPGTINIGNPHKGIDAIPDDHKELPIVTIIRDPLTWYGSYANHKLPHVVGSDDLKAAVLAGCVDSVDIIRHALENRSIGIYTEMLRTMGILGNKDINILRFESLIEDIANLLDIDEDELEQLEIVGQSPDVELPDNLIELIKEKDSEIFDLYY